MKHLRETNLIHEYYDENKNCEISIKAELPKLSLYKERLKLAYKSVDNIPSTYVKLKNNVNSNIS